MSKSFLFILLSLLLTIAMPQVGQSQAIISTQIIPANPVAGDSVYLDVDAMLSSGSCGINGYEVNIQGTDVSLPVCYWTGALTVICNSRDTLFLGDNFAAGNFNLTLLAQFTGDLNDSLCLTTGIPFDTVTTSFSIDVANSLAETLDKPLVSIYPNLVHENVWLHFHSNDQFSGQLNWINSEGKRVKEMTFHSLGAEGKVRFNTQGLLPGLYFVEIVSARHPTSVQKVLLLP